MRGAVNYGQLLLMFTTYPIVSVQFVRLSVINGARLHTFRFADHPGVGDLSSREALLSGIPACQGQLR